MEYYPTPICGAFLIAGHLGDAKVPRWHIPDGLGTWYVLQAFLALVFRPHIIYIISTVVCSHPEPFNSFLLNLPRHSGIPTSLSIWAIAFSMLLGTILDTMSWGSYQTVNPVSLGCVPKSINSPSSSLTFQLLSVKQPQNPVPLVLPCVCQWMLARPCSSFGVKSLFSRNRPNMTLGDYVGT